MSGAAYKIVESIRIVHLKYIKIPSSVDMSPIDTDLSNILTDVFAFTLIGTGILLAALGSAFNFRIEAPISFSGVVFLQNVVFWGYGMWIGYVNTDAQTIRAGELVYEILPYIVIVWAFPSVVMLIVSYSATTVAGLLTATFVLIIPGIISFSGVYMVLRIRIYKEKSADRAL